MDLIEQYLDESFPKKVKLRSLSHRANSRVAVETKIKSDESMFDLVDPDTGEAFAEIEVSWDKIPPSTQKEIKDQLGRSFKYIAGIAGIIRHANADRGTGGELLLKTAEILSKRGILLVSTLKTEFPDGSTAPAGRTSAASRMHARLGGEIIRVTNWFSDTGIVYTFNAYP